MFVLIATRPICVVDIAFGFEDTVRDRDFLPGAGQLSWLLMMRVSGLGYLLAAKCWHGGTVED
jgi:hypothetical protein